MSRLSNQHTVTLNHSFDGDNDVTLKILYVYTPGRAARGPTYDCAEEPDVEVIAVKVDDRHATADEVDDVVCCERLWQKLCDHAESNL